MTRVLRSRIFRRCCPPRASSSGASTTGSKLKLPDTPLILAGALGGPFVIFFLTPLRNALTLASQDADSSALELYANTFHGGFCNGWTGGTAPVLPSCPQFCVMGPLFHFLNEALGSVTFAVLVSAVAETTISYGSQTLNAQLAFNHEQMQSGSGLQVPLWNPFVPFGPGMTVHILRNILGMAGIRIFVAPSQAAVRRVVRLLGLPVPDGAQRFLGDLLSSMCAAMLSMPLAQCYNFAVTSQAYMHGSAVERFQALQVFLSRSYLVHGPQGEVVGLSPTLGRDVFLRCAYVGVLYTLFGSIEKLFVALFAWRRRTTRSAD
mmetsp:Transcript_45988/g.129373  ORF Transcript_45988/g.129373 Transcript_45988/m.129373 type:complete len:320 (+) Transcript_45988:3-962(+)